MKEYITLAILIAAIIAGVCIVFYVFTDRLCLDTTRSNHPTIYRPLH